jgi:hypothetical protein
VKIQKNQFLEPTLSETFAIITNKITKATIKELLNLLPILD